MTVSVLYSEIKQWVQPKPTVTNGLAEIVVTGAPTVEVSGFASAALVPDCAGATSVPQGGDAPISVNVDAALLPNPLASASVVFDNTGSGDANVAVRDAIAVAGISGLSDLVVDIGGDVGVFVFSPVDTAIPTVGSATVTIEYYGDGSTPIFPFNLPALFMGTDFSNMDADAVLGFDGDAEFVVGVSGDSLLEFTGDVDPSYTGEFDNFVTTGDAEFFVSLGGDCFVAVDGDAVLVVDATGVTVNAPLFPLRLPFVFYELS